METEVLRIIEGGLSGDKRKIIAYSTKLADRLSREGNESLSRCIRQKIDTALPQGKAVADAVRMMPIDSDSHLQIVEVHPPDEKRQKIILETSVLRQILDFVDMINRRSELELAGLDVKKTMLLYGQPGCGKTSIAHYISELTGLPLIIARLDSVVSSLLGSTAKNIRRIFDYVQSMPCILLLDEFDAIAKARDDVHELGELKRVVNSLLQNIDSIHYDCVLIAATNHPEILDKAVWRRFVQIVEVGLPSDKSINEMVKIFSEPFGNDFDFDSQKQKILVNIFRGLSPSVIKNIFDKTKVKIILHGERIIKFDDLLTYVFEETSQDKSESSYVHFLNSHGISQRAISSRCGISMRKVKSYLSLNN